MNMNDRDATERAEQSYATWCLIRDLLETLCSAVTFGYVAFWISRLF